MTHKDCESNVVNTDGEDESIFDSVQYARRESATSSISTSDDTGYITINDFKFVSKENAYTTVEKQYISNCVPDLNSFDKWNGKLITVSNAEFFIRDERNYKNKDDVFISYNALGDLVQLFDRKFSNLHQHNKISSTRTFLIHQSGLVGIAQECWALGHRLYIFIYFFYNDLWVHEKYTWVIYEEEAQF